MTASSEELFVGLQEMWTMGPPERFGHGTKGVGSLRPHVPSLGFARIYLSSRDWPPGRIEAMVHVLDQAIPLEPKSQTQNAASKLPRHITEVRVTGI